MHWTNGEHAKELNRAVAAERERCAKIADQVQAEMKAGEDCDFGAGMAAERIRADAR